MPAGLGTFISHFQKDPEADELSRSYGEVMLGPKAN